ncbi:hypothetical protein HDU96_008603 [Phlyctochytrium bullatum]|nr:hypothetical protein HDU96_008603 [Phlyctochytrium bullatum]
MGDFIYTKASIHAGIGPHTSQQRPTHIPDQSFRDQSGASSKLKSTAVPSNVKSNTNLPITGEKFGFPSHPVPPRKPEVIFNEFATPPQPTAWETHWNTWEPVASFFYDDEDNLRVI